MHKIDVLKYIFNSLKIIVLAIILSSCENADIHGTGKIIKETRLLDGFHTVIINDNVNVDFHFDSNGNNQVVIEGGEKLIPEVKAEVIDSVLFLENNNSWNWLRSFRKSKITITLNTNQIRNIIYLGVGKVQFIDTLRTGIFCFETYGGNGEIDLSLDCDSVSLVIHKGSPDVIVNGKTEILYLYNNAHGIVNALNFKGKNIVVHSKMTADCYVSPETSIGATLEYIGNVYYRNNPEILWKVEKGTGRLIQQN